MAKARIFNIAMETQDADLRESAAAILREQHGVHGLRIILGQSAIAISEIDPPVSLTVKSEDGNVSFIYEQGDDLVEEIGRAHV